MGVVVEHLPTGERKEVRTNGVFVFVGFIPNIEAFDKSLELDQWGYLKQTLKCERTSKMSSLPVTSLRNSIDRLPPPYPTALSPVSPPAKNWNRSHSDGLPELPPQELSRSAVLRRREVPKERCSRHL
jgi:hypothetical protein